MLCCARLQTPGFCKSVLGFPRMLIWTTIMGLCAEKLLRWLIVLVARRQPGIILQCFQWRLWVQQEDVFLITFQQFSITFPPGASTSFPAPLVLHRGRYYPRWLKSTQRLMDQRAGGVPCQLLEVFISYFRNQCHAACNSLWNTHIPPTSARLLFDPVLK